MRPSADLSSHARRAALALVLAGSLLPVATAGAVPFKHPKSYYTIELPEGMKPKKGDGDGVMFEGKGDGWFRIDIVPVKCGLEIASTVPVATFKKVLPNAAPDGEPSDFEVNGQPARWMVYRGTIEAGGQATPMVGIGGAIDLPTMGLSLVSLMVPEAHAKWGAGIEAAFKTIRAAGGTPPAPAPASGGAPSTSAPGTSAPAPAPEAGAGPTTYTCPSGSFDIPAGWSIKQDADGKGGTSLVGPGGATLVFLNAARMPLNKQGVPAVGENALLAGAPQFKLMPPGAYPLETRGKARISAARYQGPMVIEGQELDGRGYLGFGKGMVRGSFLCIGIALGPTAAAAQSEMEQIVQTIH